MVLIYGRLRCNGYEEAVGLTARGMQRGVGAVPLWLDLEYTPLGRAQSAASSTTLSQPKSDTCDARGRSRLNNVIVILRRWQVDANFCRKRTWRRY